MIDASATVPWCFADEATPETETLLDRLRSGDRAIVPAHWPTEVMNALIMGVRRQRLTFSQALEFTEAVAALPIQIASPSAVGHWAPLLGLASRTQLTVYDAAYLQLAIQYGVPLATFDKKLQQAARTVGILLAGLA